MSDLQLNFPRTGASSLSGEFTNAVERRVLKSGTQSAKLANVASSVPSLGTTDITDLSPNDEVAFWSSDLSREVAGASVTLTYSVTKRTLDVALASIGILFLSPILLITALLIKAETAGPAIFKQRRRGLYGRTFLIWKLRTMTVLEDGQAVEQARRGDSRVTRIGYLLRRSSIDELPQLINVIKGEMSLVGPRPHPLALDDKHRRLIPRYELRHVVKPGITGWAQINGCRGECSQLKQMQARIDHDLWYVKNQSSSLDLWILFRTVLSLSRFDAY